MRITTPDKASVSQQMRGKRARPAPLNLNNISNATGRPHNDDIVAVRGSRPQRTPHMWHRLEPSLSGAHSGDADENDALLTQFRGPGPNVTNYHQESSTSPSKPNVLKRSWQSIKEHVAVPKWLKKIVDPADESELVYPPGVWASDYLDPDSITPAEC